MAVTRLNELPEETREFLDRLRPEDVKTLEEGISLVRSFRTVGRIMKWFIVGLVGTVVAISSLWESGQKLLGLYRGH